MSEYRADEIPGAEALGLDPEAAYAMFRPPAELRKAASTMSGVPILSAHQPMSATTFDPALIVGACLDDAVFEVAVFALLASSSGRLMRSRASKTDRLGKFRRVMPTDRS